MKQKIKFIGRRRGVSTYQVESFYVHVPNKAELLKMLAARKPHEAFYVSETYSQTTPESASNGDFSETGYFNYGEFCTLKEVLDMERIKYGRNNGDGTFYDSNWRTIDYREGIEEELASHISANPRNMARFEKILNLKKNR